MPFRCPKALVAAVMLAVPLEVSAQVAPSAPSEIIDVQSLSGISGTCGGSASLIAFDRRVAGNTVVPFSVPAGKDFVVTAIDWQVSGLRLNRARTARFFRVLFGGMNGPSAMSTSMSDDVGQAGASVTFPTGIVISSGTSLCVQLDGGSTSDRVSAVAHGFLTTAR
jgi:hypothetical protein